MGEQVSTTVEFQIVRLSILEFEPDRLGPIPIPEPSPSELTDPRCEHEINKAPIEELASGPLTSPVPIPEPESEVASMTDEFQRMRSSILDDPPHSAYPVPIPEP
jgi:hypothetical protein